MSFSTSGPARKDPGNINLSGQKPKRGDGKSADDDLDELAAKPEASGDATSSRPSARRRRRGADTATEKTAERDEGSADSPSDKTDAESEAQEAPLAAAAAKDEVADDDHSDTADPAERDEGAEAKPADAKADVEPAEKQSDDKKADAAAAQDKTEKAVEVPEKPDRPSVIDTTPAAQSGGAHGLFGVAGSGDTSGMSGLMRPAGTGIPFDSSPRPYGGYFDEVADVLAASYPNWSTAHLATLVDRGEITFYVKKEHIARICQVLRDTAALRFELLAALSGVDYLRPDATVPVSPMSSSTSTTTDPRTELYRSQRLHVVYHLLSLTYRRRIRVEVATTVEDPHVPSVSKVYPTADWQERETYDMFGVIFDGHQALTRILMPDDWEGFPQRKDYPLGGIPVEYKGASIPPPDERRVYR